MTSNNSQDKIFIVENGFNTCYIDSLLMALFYKSSTYLESILHTYPKNFDVIYLQEIIKNKFVDQVRKYNSIMADVINEIRLYAHECGWLSDNELFEQQDVNEFYSFLLNTVNAPLIEIQRQTFSEELDNKNGIGESETIPFINLIVPDNCTEISIKTMLNNWMNNNEIKTDYYKCLNIYKIVNVPTFIALSLNRFNNNMQRIETKIDIQKRIKLHHIYDDHEGLIWKIHAIICHKGLTPKTGHYYSVIFSSDNTILLFDDQSIPCLKDIKINDKEIAETIKREAIFVIYCYNESL